MIGMLGGAHSSIRHRVALSPRCEIYGEQDFGRAQMISSAYMASDKAVTTARKAGHTLPRPSHGAMRAGTQCQVPIWVIIA